MNNSGVFQRYAFLSTPTWKVHFKTTRRRLQILRHSLLSQMGKYLSHVFFTASEMTVLRLVRNIPARLNFRLRQLSQLRCGWVVVARYRRHIIAHRHSDGK